ncbi:MAG TPA: acetate--CoA ligase family protein [Candidatus Limnocylindria bacterium]|nr:acetate--CoA ligase family protein [Candidatus Limnocylindria bacterium]
MAEPVTLSEHASKQLLAPFGVPFARERLAPDAPGAVRAARELGFPVVVKLCGDAIAHKTERGLVRLGCRDAAQVEAAAAELLAAARPEDGPVALLVAEQVASLRELIAGLVRDPQFGPCVLLGAGGVLAEALGAAAFAAAPLAHAEARRMIDALGAHALLTRPLRGEPGADVDALADLLVALGRVAEAHPEIASVDLNPVLLRDGRPVAVDALVVRGTPAPAEPVIPASDAETLRARFRPLFHPRGIVVAGVSSHPGKFGFVAYHNLLRFGYRGALFPVTRDGAPVLDMPTLRRVADVPEGAADLVVVCTPPAVNPGLLRECAARGVRAAFVASGGYGELGAEGRARERELVATADELGMLLAGPNGQGVVSTRDAMCAQIVAPFPPPGRIAIASQSGNLVSTFENYARASGIGVSVAISAGNAAQTTLADYLEYFGVDDDTGAVLAYVESVGDGRRFLRAVRRVTAEKPLIVLKGGAAQAGQRAAASHTGALATDERIFAGVCRQAGVLRAPTAEAAFEWAASLVTQPLPRGRRVVIVTTAGGWGVLAADACAVAALDVIPLPDDLEAAIDALLPARWSRNNPIDPAGGETRDTVPAIIDLAAGHPDVDAVLVVGIGIQANQAAVFRSGRFFPAHGLDRIAEFHERQDRRYALAAVDASERHGKPVLVATELVHTADPPGNAAPLALRERGRFCHPSAHRAVATLRAMVDYAEFRRSLG